jgi:hypothetical protein
MSMPRVFTKLDEPKPLDDEALLALVVAGHSMKECARRLGTTTAMVIARVRQIGLTASTMHMVDKESCS